MTASTSTETSVLVVGATGNQGGAVADHLLSEDDERFEVHALTRNHNSPAATALAERGATVVEGDLDDKASLQSAIEGVDAVFSVTNYFIAGYDGEIRQGTNIAEVAADVGVEHFVYSSVGGAERDTGIEHFDSKYEVERRIERLDLPATILRPVFFMYNFDGMRETVRERRLALPLNEGVSLQMLDVSDHGAFAARVLATPERYIGEVFEVAGDERTLEEMAAAFSEVTGRTVEPVHVPLQRARNQRSDDITAMYEWFNESGYDGDIQALEREHDLQFTRLSDYLRKHNWDEI